MVEPSSPAATPTSDRAARLFRWLVDQFGASKMERDYGTEASSALISLVGRLTDDELKRGCRAVRDLGNDWPPSLPALERHCKTQVAPKADFFPKLPRNVASDDVAAASIAKMRQTLAAAGTAEVRRLANEARRRNGFAELPEL